MCFTFIYLGPFAARGGMAVMVFVHGDSYEYGSGNAYDPSVMVSYGQIIGITLNFRLGLFGKKVFSIVN